MIVWVYLVDDDNSCSDPDCCGGPYPSPYIKVYSSVEKAEADGRTKDELTAITVDDTNGASINFN